MLPLKQRRVLDAYASGINAFITQATTLGKGYPYSLGHNYAHDYRAFRINEKLAASRSIAERDMRNLQLAAKSRVYNFYRALALEVLGTATRRALLRWDGRARADSIGFGFLTELRRRLIETTFAPFLQRCLDRDSDFSYRWFKVDSPLRQLLLAKRPETLPTRIATRIGTRFYLTSSKTPTFITNATTGINRSIT